MLHNWGPPIELPSLWGMRAITKSLLMTHPDNAEVPC